MVGLMLMTLLIISIVLMLCNRNTALLDSFIGGYTLLVAIAKFGTGHWVSGIWYGLVTLCLVWTAYTEKLKWSRSANGR